MTRPLRLILLLVGLALAGPAAAARPAGWVRTRIGLCSLEAPARAAAVHDALANRAGAILPEVEAELGLHPASRYRMVLIPPGGAGDPEIDRIDAAAPPWAAGYLVPSLRIGAIRIAQAAQYPYGTLEAVLAHESVHLLIHDAVGGRVPLWFNEGVATWQGRRWSLEDRLVYARALLTSDLPSLAALDTAFHASPGEAQLAYAASFAFVSWNVNRHGPGLVARVLRESRTRGFAAAWRAASGDPLERSEAQWRRASLIRYRWVPILTASSTLWIAITFLAVAAGVRKRARIRKLREQWEREEAQDPLEPYELEDEAVEDPGSPPPTRAERGAEPGDPDRPG